MANVNLSGQALVTVEETLRFLQDQGSPKDDNDLLRNHINGVSSMMIKLTGRNRLIWVDDDTITEFRDGFGDNSMYLYNAPVRKIVSVTLLPHETTGTSVTVPTEPATFSDGMYFDSRSGLIVLKGRVFPAGMKQTKIEYEAGYYKQDIPSNGDPADAELMELKMIALNAIARKWARWKNQRHGVSSESRGDTQINYNSDDITKSEIIELKRYRRSLFS